MTGVHPEERRMDEVGMEMTVMDFEEAAAAGLRHIVDWMEYNRIRLLDGHAVMWSLRCPDMGLQPIDGNMYLVFRREEGGTALERVAAGHEDDVLTAIRAYMTCMDDWGFQDAWDAARNEVDPLTKAIEELMDDCDLEALMHEAWVQTVQKGTADEEVLKVKLYGALYDYAVSILDSEAPECAHTMLVDGLEAEFGDVITELLSWFAYRLCTPWDERDQTPSETDSEEE